MENHTSIRSVPVGYGVTWISVSWSLAKRNYKQALKFVLVLIVWSILLMIIMRLPRIGGILYFLSPIFSLPFSCGFFIVGRKFVRHEPTQFKDLFGAFFDKKLMARLVPYLIFSWIFALPTAIFLYKNIQVFGLVGPQIPRYQSLISGVAGVLAIFSLPQIMFQEKSFLQTILPNVMAILKNILPIVLFLIAFMLLTAVTTILLLLPVFLITLPIGVPLYYVVYATIFENYELPEKAAAS